MRILGFYVVCYDISDDTRRQRVARLMLTYGQRVQRSVYEVWLEPEDRRTLCREVGILIARSDRFDLFPVDRRDPENRLAWQQSPRRRRAVQWIGYP